ncbi:hypothetical protein J1N35_026476 [Gossypium stocksii]|uniref:Uncharacterized protein n=1 Tax=Gossypium stocksii TaxID=47602 RepID=A0A9D3ZZ96_9ROSI|nr:hypothetical protein J1N35_026476 [Gossypium stocksii]
MLNDVEKNGGRRIVRAHINKFRDVLDDLALVDIKPDRGEGDKLIKERLDRFFILVFTVRQTQSDHDAILFDLYGRIPSSNPIDTRLRFCYEECWVKENDVSNYGNKLDRGDSVKRLKKVRCKLDYIYAREEKYWAKRSRTQWLKEGDRNTKYFYAKATGRLKKNRIEKLKDGHGNWSNGNDTNYHELDYISDCIIREKNEWLTRVYTESGIL